MRLNLCIGSLTQLVSHSYSFNNICLYYIFVTDNSNRRNPISKLHRIPGETGRAFSLRINNAMRTLNSDLHEHEYPVNVFIIFLDHFILCNVVVYFHIHIVIYN